jgi:hypothetical protein
MANRSESGQNMNAPEAGGLPHKYRMDRRKFLQRTSDVLVAIGGITIGVCEGDLLTGIKSSNEIDAITTEKYPPPNTVEREISNSILQSYQDKTPETLTHVRKKEVEHAIKIKERQEIYLKNYTRDLQANDNRAKRDVIGITGGLLVVGIAKVLDSLAKRKAAGNNQSVERSYSELTPCFPKAKY